MKKIKVRESSKKLATDLFDVIVREFRNILTSFSIMVVIIGGNVLYAFLYPTPYLNDIVLHQEIAIVDDDNTKLSRQFIFNASATPQIEIHSITSMQNATSLLERNEVYGILHIPSGFERDATKAATPQVYYIADASYFLIYSTIIEGLNNASKGLNVSIKQSQALYKDTKISHEAKQPILWDFVPLYNPTIGYMNYALAAILIFILHQTILISCGILGGTQLQQYYRGSGDYSTQSHQLLIILSRIFVFFVIYIPLFLFYFGYIYNIYNISTLSGILELMCFGIGFVVATTAFGIFFGSLFNRREQASQIIIVFSIPFLFALGFIWPSELIPEFIKFFMMFLPITPTIDGFLKINQMGADFSLIKNNLIHLIVLLILYISLAYAILSYKVKSPKLDSHIGIKE